MNDAKPTCGWNEAKPYHPPKSEPPVRSSELVRCAFTKCEADHILSLIWKNERNGEHTAPAKQYWNRSNRIINKLRDGYESAKAPNDPSSATPPNEDTY